MTTSMVSLSRRAICNIMMLGNQIFSTATPSKTSLSKTAIRNHISTLCLNSLDTMAISTTTIIGMRFRRPTILIPTGPRMAWIYNETTALSKIRGTIASIKKAISHTTTITKATFEKKTALSPKTICCQIATTRVRKRYAEQ